MLPRGLDALRFTLKKTLNLVMIRRICIAGNSYRYHHRGGSETVSEYAYFQTSSEFSFLDEFSLPSSSMLSTLPTIIGDLKVTIRQFLARVQVS